MYSLHILHKLINKTLAFSLLIYFIYTFIICQFILDNGILLWPEAGTRIYLHHPLHVDHSLQNLDEVGCKESGWDHFEETERGISQVSVSSEKVQDVYAKTSYNGK